MKPLKRMNAVMLYHYVNGEKIRGNCSGLMGDCSGLWGNCSDLRGDCDIIPWHERKDHPEVLYWVEEST